MTVAQLAEHWNVAPAVVSSNLTSCPENMKKKKQQIYKPDPTMVRYFAYGANMNSERMLERCPSAILVGHAVLPDHRLVFDVPCRFVSGCAANIRWDETQVVHGVLWIISKKDFKVLDARERNYGRILTTVYHPSGIPYDAYIYYCKREGREEPPDESYISSMCKAAVRNNFPKRYTNWLATHPKQ